jgi:putative transposase
LGIPTFAYTSDNEQVNYDKQKLTKLRKYSRRYQRQADKCKKDSNRNRKNRKLQNKTNIKIKNIVEDLQHKTTTDIIKNNQVIVIEDLNIVGMLKNPKLSRSIKEQNWGSFINKLEYKSTRAGRTLIRVPRFFPSSKLCSCCGHKMEKMPLSIRTWTCPECKTEHNRDHNAAINILNCGLNQLIPGGAGEFTDVDIEKSRVIARSQLGLDNSAMDESSTYILVKSSGTTPLDLAPL